MVHILYMGCPDLLNVGVNTNWEGGNEGENEWERALRSEQPDGRCGANTIKLGFRAPKSITFKAERP